MTHSLDLHDGTGVLATIPGLGIIQAAGDTVPSDGASGYATGCLFQHTNGGAGTSLYVNEGTNTSCDFNAVAGA